MALQTITTVGYGDVTPTQLIGRLLGAVVMLQGTAFIAIVTAVITSTFVARATRAHDEDAGSLERRLDVIERKLDLLARPRGRDE